MIMLINMPTRRTVIMSQHTYSDPEARTWVSLRQVYKPQLDVEPSPTKLIH